MQRASANTPVSVWCSDGYVAAQATVYILPYGSTNSNAAYAEFTTNDNGYFATTADYGDSGWTFRADRSYTIETTTCKTVPFQGSSHMLTDIAPALLALAGVVVVVVLGYLVYKAAKGQGASNRVRLGSSRTRRQCARYLY